MRIKLGVPLRLETICEATGGAPNIFLPHLQIITHISTSSKEVERGDMFIALKGENHDGHNYIKEAISFGASLILCEKDYISSCETAYYIHVDNTLEALAKLAAHYKKLFRHKTIAITGSVGKTTTRHFIANVLKTRYKIHESPENYNNLLGVSLTLLSAPLDTEYLVLELGMDGKGQISKMTKLVHPDVAVITNIGISHMEKLGSQMEICYAKLEILHGMDDGKLLIEGADPYLSRFAPEGAITVSANHPGTMCRSINEVVASSGITFDYVSPAGLWKQMYIPTLGRHTLSCALFAIAVAQTQGIEEKWIRMGLSTFTPPYQRQTILYGDRITILLDAYNACPASMQGGIEAAKLLAKERGGPLCAILGDMLELGDKEVSFHEQIGASVAKAEVAILYLYGTMAMAYKAGAISAGLSPKNIHILSFDMPLPHRAELIKNTIPKGSILFIKGSRKNHLEDLIPYLNKTGD